MKSENNKIYLFEQMPIPKAVLQLSIPSIIGCLVMVIYNLADTYFVGQLNDSVETAAVTLVAPVILAFNAVNNLFGTGTSSLISRMLGLKKYDVVKRTSAFGFYMAIFSGIFFSVAVILFKDPLLNLLGVNSENYNSTYNYLFWTVICGAVPSILNVVMGFIIRAEGLSLLATLGTMSGCVLNIILDPFFILPFGLNMGAAGAGLATLISNTVACLFFLIAIFIKKNSIFMSISFSDFKPDRILVRDVFSVGVPAAIQNLLNVTGMTVLNNLTSGYGTDAVSAIGISHKIAMVPMYISMGVAQGVMPLLGYNFAAKNKQRMRSGVKFTVVMAGGFMLLSTAALFIFSETIVSLFMENETIVSYGGAFLKGFAVALPFLGVDFLGVGIFQACGKGGITFIFALLRKIVFEIPALIILNKIFPMYGLGYAQFVAELILSVVSTFLLIDLLKDKEVSNTN